MALTEEQIIELKKQLSEQIKNLPEDQKKQAQDQIDSMTSDALESMLKQQQEKQQIFRQIVEGKIPSKKIAENEDALAILDIKPISKGHTLIIPKIAVKKAKDISQNTFNLAKEVVKQAHEKLDTESAEILTQFNFGEIIINVIPIYDKSLNLDSPRTEISEEELEKISQKMKLEKKVEIIKETKKEKETIKLNRKIP
ncbi:TPA: HIT domain-containing protein [Candidatus Pacearchaeota archaeon]|jgi:histidine triad (HIT) family protein|nr:HIT domain-containing protein [Candidatus Pacearchaeota archaeon]